MKKLLITLTILVNQAQANNLNKEMDIAVSSFYTGCMAGIVATIEEGMFKESTSSEQARLNFKKLKQNCLNQQKLYKKFLKEGSN